MKGTMITKCLTGKGENTVVVAYAINTITSQALSGFSPFELVFV